ncbi:ribosomal RNA small subunit methyltransferase H [Bacteroidia bacterium]|nr:ribosomal RNA small subunit methyltransferase H [Bacteroidia bacterium]
MYHIPVLREESVAGLALRDGGVYVDATFGGGGHTREMLDHFSDGRLFAFDQDADAQSNVPDDNRFELIPQNFRYAKNFLKMKGVLAIDGLLADLGVSSHQIDTPERGFSFRYDAPLDLRMNRQATLSANNVINTYSLEQLTCLFCNYGELHNGKAIAERIVHERTRSAITTTTQLVQTLKPMLSPKIENKLLAMVFQALRIEVNQELEALKQLLLQSLDLLRQGGRLVIISYHSLEDRLVKYFMKTGNCEGELHKDFYGNSLSPFKLITRKAIVPSDTEIAINLRARSAKLRIAEKL